MAVETQFAQIPHEAPSDSRRETAPLPVEFFGGATVSEAKSSRFAIPEYSVDGMTILDVGCQTGRDFTSSHYAHARALYGVDIDREAIHEGQRKYPHIQLSVDPAEKLPFGDAFFDLVISRVALPYTNIPVALKEIYRVLKPGGYLFLSMHDVQMQLLWLKEAIRKRAIKRIVDHAYIFPASILFNLTGVCVARPWSNRMETFQTVKRMRKALLAVSFARITTERTDRLLIFEARRTY
jgi:ubiquinone/menaquinone biosynthesis C-methylase UbiE